MLCLKSWLGTVAVISLVAGTAMAQPEKKAPAGAAPTAAQPPKGDKPAAGGHDEMAQWAEMAKPVEQHAKMKEMAGTWDAEVKTWMDPTQDPMVSKGTMVNTLTHGDRFLHHDFKGEFMGQVFTGSGDWGYNKITGKFEGTWMDSMGTAIMFSTGSYDEKTKTYTSTATFDMPGPDGKPMKVTQKETVEVLSADKHVMKMYHSAAGMPQEMKVLEITYTRAGKGAAAPTGGAGEKPKAPAAPSAK